MGLYVLLDNQNIKKDRAKIYILTNLNLINKESNFNK